MKAMHSLNLHQPFYLLHGIIRSGWCVDSMFRSCEAHEKPYMRFSGWRHFSRSRSERTLYMPILTQAPSATPLLIEQEAPAYPLLEQQDL